MNDLRHPRQDEALVFSKYINPVVKCVSVNCTAYHIPIMNKGVRPYIPHESSIEVVDLKESFYYYCGKHFRIFGDYELDENNKNKIIEFLIEKFWSK